MCGKTCSSNPFSRRCVSQVRFAYVFGDLDYGGDRFALRPDDAEYDSYDALDLGDSALLPSYAAEQQQGVVLFEATRKASLRQSHFNFAWYPFDKQQVRITLDMRGNFTTCGTPALFPGFSNEYLEEWLTPLLTSENGWEIDGPPSSYHPDQGVVTRCTMEIPIRRIPHAYIYQNVIPATLVCIAALFALLLNSESADTTAGRASVLLVAMLLLVEKVI
eukprot:5606474-Prymnesium_polylepis.3